MKKLLYLLCFLPLAACQKNNTVAPQVAPEFATADEAKTYFYRLDDDHNRAMVAKDSAYFARYYSAPYYNCTPNNELNNKAAEIQTLIHGPWQTVERMAPQFDIFAYTPDLTTMIVTKRIKIRTPAGDSFLYVRRSIVFQKISGQWQAISGQGTYVATRFVGQ